MGVGAANTLARVAASVGELEYVTPDFEAVLDVPNGGVLFALPALMASGLLKFTARFFQLPKGYYGLTSIFLLLAFMALARIKTIESLRYDAPGEWGKLLGLDRIPEVRTLRQKVQCLSQQDQATQWSAALCQYWMEATPEHAAVLYVDGHVRVYHGHQTKLPRHHVARQKLCCRATTDYWVNAMDGQPFMVINQVVDPGLIQVIENTILPDLKQRVPNQPNPQQLSENPLLHRFTLVFDREGYSPDFLKRMKKERVACLTYHKFPGDAWREDEFKSASGVCSAGLQVDMKLAERGTRLSNGLWVREIRKLTERGHQTAIIATDYVSNLAPVAVTMFSRWSQENFFKYMREQYNLDRLIDYQTEPVDDTTKLVNPIYRDLDGQVRSLNGQLSRKLAKFGAMNLEEPIEPPAVEAFLEKKSSLQETIEHLQNKIQELKAKRKEVPRHTTVKGLPEKDRFEQLSTQSKHLIDTLKMIAYRAETAMASLVRETLSTPDEARRLLQALYQSEADLLPDHQQRTLTVQLHHLANPRFDKVIRKLCEDLNATETRFPGTELRLVMKLGSS